MPKKILTLLGSALIAASATQVAIAAQPHHPQRVARERVKTQERWRNSNAYVPAPAQPDLGVMDEALSPPAGQ